MTTPTTIVDVSTSAPEATTPDEADARRSTTVPSGPATTVAPGQVPADNLNLAVNQANIASTICVRGYTATIRPPVSYTDPLKRHQIATYGYADHSTGSFEEDHVIALEDGGNPSNPANLWPEPHKVSSADDQLENVLHSQVCAGTMTLAAAQAQLYTTKTAHGYDRAKSLA